MSSYSCRALDAAAEVLERRARHVHLPPARSGRSDRRGCSSSPSPSPSTAWSHTSCGPSPSPATDRCGRRSGAVGCRRDTSAGCLGPGSRSGRRCGPRRVERRPPARAGQRLRCERRVVLDRAVGLALKVADHRRVVPRLVAALDATTCAARPWSLIQFSRALSPSPDPPGPDGACSSPVSKFSGGRSRGSARRP